MSISSVYKLIFALETLKMKKKPISVVIIDDHRVLIDGLISLLTIEGITVSGSANTFDQGLYILKELEYNVALIDINLEGDDGLALIKSAKDRDKKVLILSSYTDIRLIKEALRKGADGYLTKESTSNHIIEAIQSVNDGINYFDPIIQQKLNQSFIKSSPDHKVVERVIEAHLTKREREVLILIAHQMTSEEIADKLYIAKSTVDTYRKNLIEKLKVKNAVGLGLWASKNGLI